MKYAERATSSPTVPILFLHTLTRLFPAMIHVKPCRHSSRRTGSPRGVPERSVGCRQQLSAPGRIVAVPWAMMIGRLTQMPPIVTGVLALLNQRMVPRLPGKG